MENIKNWVKKNWKIIVVVIYTLLILTFNLTKARFEIDLIVISVFLIAALFGEAKRFVKDWLPAIFLFWFYEYTRGLAHVLAERFNRPILVQELVDVERKLFFFLRDIPTVVIQDALHPDNITRWYDPIFFFFYTSFYWLWLLTGFIFWKFKREYFFKYFYGLLSFSLFSNIIYFIFPTAPPWYASEQGFIPPMQRVMWSINVLNRGGVSVANLLDDNQFAALPSLHTGWSWYAALFLVKYFGWEKAGWTFIFPIMIMFAIVYGAEHYVIDIIAGLIVSTVAFWIVTREKKNVVTK